MALVNAADKKSGDILPYLVPEHWIDHPVLGKNIKKLPSDKAAKATKKPAVGSSHPVNPTTDTPAAGDHEGN